ncbi:hypothetical protein SLA2020_169950 [Shorea laevis]
MEVNSIQNDEVQILIDGRLELLSALQIQKPQIFKVPRELREVNKNAYEPYIVSIGPYHHGKDHLKAMEVHKVRFLKMLLQRTNQPNTFIYVAAMRGMMGEVRNCYAECLTMSMDKFLEMIVLDGCFVVELFHQLYHRKWHNDELFKVDMIFSRILLDLMLFENQLPFSVIWKLLDMGVENEKIEYIKSFFEVFDDSILPGFKVKDANGNEGLIESAKHLLDLVHTRWSSSMGGKGNVTHGEGSISWVKYPLYSVHTNCISPTDYIILMDCLMNTEKDVELLCQSGIISTFLGDNAAVATLFNGLGYHVSFSLERFFYKELFGDVNKHYGSFWNRNMAKLRHDYFNSPWSLISFLAAVFLLLLSLLQTIFTILPWN